MKLKTKNILILTMLLFNFTLINVSAEVNNSDIKYYPISDNCINEIFIKENTTYKFSIMDSSGKTYNNMELGYFYPLDMDYCKVTKADKWGNYIYAIWDRNGNAMLKDLSENKDGYFKNVMDVDGNTALIELSGGEFYEPNMALCNISTGKILSRHNEIYKLSTNLYCYSDFGEKADKIVLINSEGNKLTSKEFDKLGSGNFYPQNIIVYNNTFTLSSNNKLYILTTNGEIKKELPVDFSKYELISTSGSNALLYNNQSGKYEILKCYSENYIILDGNNAKSCENGEFITYNDSGYSVYNSDVSIKYQSLSDDKITYIGNNTYLAYKECHTLEHSWDINEYYTGKIINKNGKLIERSNVYIYNYAVDENVIAYFKKGKLIVSSLSDDGTILFEKTVDKPRELKIINGGVKYNGEYVYFN